jgi:hypothetical protein
MLDTYTILWDKLWHQQDNVYRHEHLPTHGDYNSALTYELYDFSSLPHRVLPGRKDTNFIIRKEYHTLYDTLWDWYNEQITEAVQGAVVTGHPGISVLSSKREPEPLLEHCFFFQENQLPCGIFWFKDCFSANPPLSRTTANGSFLTTLG